MELPMHIICHYNIAHVLSHVVSCASGLSIVFYRSHSELRDTPTYRKLEWLVCRILLFTLLPPSDSLTNRELAWLANRIL